VYTPLAFLSCWCALAIRTRPIPFVLVCALHSACGTLTPRQGFLSGTDFLGLGPRSADQPPSRPDNSAPNFDHFNTFPRRPGPPLAATSCPQPSRCGARPGPSRSDPRLRHFDKAGLPTSGPGFEWHPILRVIYSPYPDSDDTAELEPVPLPPGICQLWTCRSTSVADTGY
jgi:hypothetical protein